jgi:hypothetical protein
MIVGWRILSEEYKDWNVEIVVSSSLALLSLKEFFGSCGVVRTGGATIRRRDRSVERPPSSSNVFRRRVGDEPPLVFIMCIRVFLSE